MTLEEHQRGVLDLIKHRSPAPTDPYLCAVAESTGLCAVRRIALFWRTLQLEAQCRLTSSLLRRLGVFEELVASYYSSSDTSPYSEVFTRDFLDWLGEHPEPLVQAVSSFELAMFQISLGACTAAETVWDRDPDRVLRALQMGGDLPTEEGPGVYRLRLDRELTGLFRCSRTDQPSHGIRE